MKSYKYDLINNENIYTLIIHLNHLNEFSDESSIDDENNLDTSLIEDVKIFATNNFPNIKISFVKVMIGAIVLFSAPLSGIALAETSYKVQSGDTLWKIATRYGISVNRLKGYNNLTSDTIYVGQNLRIPSADAVTIKINGTTVAMNPETYIIDGVTYVPVRAISEALGASVWWNSISNTVGIDRGNVKIAFVAGSSVARINGVQTSIQPTKIINNTTYVPIRFITDAFGLNLSWDDKTKTVNITEYKTNAYVVVAGDSLWSIGQKFNVSVTALKSANNLTSDTIYIGQKLTIPTTETVNQSLTVTYINHTVKQGDNLWNLSIYYGIPLTELLSVNNMNQNSNLTIGQIIKVPVHHIPVKPVVSEKHGELLDWWTEAQYVFAINDVAKVTDYKTGKSFYIKRTIGANHADCEPLTANDSAIIKEVWGGSYSWTSRAVIVEVDGRKLAASMSSMPHDIQYINNNNFDGHFDVHFLNSTRHSDGQITDSHQDQIKIAAGVA